MSFATTVAKADSLPAKLPAALHRRARGALIVPYKRDDDREDSVPFKRRVSKQSDTPITPAMIRLFEAMRRCNGNRWDDLHGELFDRYCEACAPRPKVWQWPVVQSPAQAAERGERPAALALWQALNEASREARAARKTGLSARRNGRSTDQPPLG